MKSIVLILFALILTTACRAKFQPYSAHENLLSIAAEYELLDATDPYREPPAEELTGQGIARATLVRLANYESLHPERFTPEISFLKARAFERLGDYETARISFLRAAETDSLLRDEALRRADINRQFVAAGTLSPNSSSIEQVIANLQQQSDAYSALADELDDEYYQALARVAAEQTDVRRAEMIAANRWVLPDGEAQAIEALRRVVANHAQSHRALEHALRFARFYRELAEEEIRLHPPSTFDFNKERAVAFLRESLDLLHRISQADGREERLIAQRELDTVLLLYELVNNRAD